jgi:nucleoside recognition membrane protein YjiH
MFFLTAFGSPILYLVFWIALLWVCFDLYRTFRFTSLPWLGGYCLISIVSRIIGIIARGVHPPRTASAEMRMLFSAWQILTPLTHVLIATIILSEIAFLISRVPEEKPSRLVSVLLRVHRNMKILGSVLLISAAAWVALDVAWLVGL